MKVGFVGLGLMGSRMAGRLQEAGYELVVYNRTGDKATPLVQKGAAAAGSPAEVGRQSDILFTMLAHPNAVRETAVGEQGFLDKMAPDTLWVDSSTVNPSFSRQMAYEATRRNVRFLDAPVAGTKGVAAQGQLSFFVGGTAADLEACRPLLEKMGSKIFHLGEHGKGTSFKMVSNLLLGAGMAAFAEGMVLGQSLGIPQQRLFEMLLGGAVVPGFASGKRPKIESGDFEADFPIRWMQKDLQLAADTAYEQGVSLPVINTVKEAYLMAIRQGYGEMDFSAIYAFLQHEK